MRILLLDDARKKWQNRKEYRALADSYRTWRAANPDAPLAAFYARHKLQLMNSGAGHVAHGLGLPMEAGAQRTTRLLTWLRAEGLKPEHVCVDYGCGSLWDGEVLMDYLDPGGYIGLDVVDDFFVAARKRLAPELVRTKRPELHVIFPQTLEHVRGRRPDFVVCRSVLNHVPPDEKGLFFATLMSLAASHTRTLVTHEPGAWTRQLKAYTWRHSRRAIRTALASLGHVARFRPFYHRSVMIEISPGGTH